MPRTHDASGIVIIDEQNRILLVHQTYKKKHWSLPGGIVEDNESVWEMVIYMFLEQESILVNVR
ncbi:NUDIX domain-containing protein [Paenibacillus gallinarum]|uniref:NUDIX hydrolase n=1 Tax=Paenibacillus gallinarum TaxID=2762232 RepID=A0ABR8ST42_9BACL|nr:NUDIX hydrolase [Paenibacillus gallinarum]MBD7966668.1 NUDIX hydrolase [Paenibacillus gallinarum]